MQANVTNQLTYLYGDDVDTSSWAAMPYRDVLELKVRLSDSLIGRLYSVHYTHRDHNRVNDCAAAMSFNRKLLQELPCHP